jgi:hypothetical protein
LVAIAGQKPHNGRGQQTVKLGAAFVRGHAVWMQRIGAANVAVFVCHACNPAGFADLPLPQNGSPLAHFKGWNRSTL